MKTVVIIYQTFKTAFLVATKELCSVHSRNIISIYCSIFKDFVLDCLFYDVLNYLFEFFCSNYFECISDRVNLRQLCSTREKFDKLIALNQICLLYTSDAADDLLCVDL